MKTTVNSSAKNRGQAKGDHGAGLLQFFPLGSPPSMAYHAFRSERIVVGRADGCELTIWDEEASREHAAFDFSRGHWQVEDLDSTNGLFAFGQKISSQPLVGGEIIRIGSSLFRFFSAGLSSTSVQLPISSGSFVAGPAFGPIFDGLNKAASSDLSVLVLGETGTGKELVARYLHDQGPRRTGPFVPVNCSAIPRDIFESELFGHVRGAFSGAIRERTGLVPSAAGGTLFLDEVGDLPAEGQAKLLRVLQTKTVLPVGGHVAQNVDVRFVCATNRNLDSNMVDGTFRSDLYARLGELVVDLPPLRHRAEDIPLLTQHFLHKHGAHKSLRLTAAFAEHLACQRWPLNVRELESAIKRACVFADSGVELTEEHIHPTVKGAAQRDGNSAPEDPLRRVRIAMPAADQDAAHELTEALAKHEGDPNKTAAELGISRSQLYRRAQKLGIRVGDFKR